MSGLNRASPSYLALAIRFWRFGSGGSVPAARFRRFGSGGSVVAVRPGVRYFGLDSVTWVIATWSVFGGSFVIQTR
jgi:hypothetical protein